MKRKRLLWCAGLGLTLAFGAGSAPAQAPAIRALPAQQQGFEATSQNPANYTPEEAAAVAVVKKWIDTTNTKDLAAHMALVDDNVVFRGDSSAPLKQGALGYCTYFTFIRSNTWVRLDELYVVGGPSGTLVLLLRTDTNGAPSGNDGGSPVEVADLLRIKDGKIIEWYDAPIVRIGPRVTPPPNPLPPGAPGGATPEVCRRFPGQATPPTPGAPALAQPPSPQPQPVAPLLSAGMLSYGVTKPESRFNMEEESAAQTIRAWFAAWQAGNPLLLGAFVDQRVIFRASPAAGSLVAGRDALLKAACGTIGGPLNLTGIYVIGAYFDTLAIARWNKVDAAGNRTRMGSFFRVQNGLIVEWMDTQLEGTPIAANPNSAACQTVNTTLAAFAPGPTTGPPAAAPAAAPAGAQPPR